MLAILFALILQTSNYGNYWTTPSWCPKSTDSRLTPGSDTFIKEDNYQLTTNGAAAFYSVLDAFDTRKFIFSNGSTNIAKHIVSSRGLDNYDAFLARKSALRNLACFGDGGSSAGGETFDKWMLANGYSAFGGYDWQSNPFPDPSAKSIVWFPTSRIFASDDIFTEYVGYDYNIAKTVLESISYIPLGWNDWYGHDWNADYLDEDEGSFKMFLSNAYERVWFDGMTNNSRVIDWKPVEMAAKVLGTYDKLYVVSEGQPFSSITNYNSVSGLVTYRTEGSTVSRVRLDVLSPSGEIRLVDTGSGALPVGDITSTSETIVVSCPSDKSCPSMNVSAVTASGSIGASVQIGTFGVSDDWKSELGAYLYLTGVEEAEIVSTFGKDVGLTIRANGDPPFIYSRPSESSISHEPGMLVMPVTGHARASYSAADSVISAVPDENYFCTISTNVASYVTNVNYFAFMAASNTADGVSYKCAKYANRTVRGANGFGPTLRGATQTLDERVEHGLEANVYDATDYCNFSESDAERIWGMCDEPVLSVEFGDANVVTNYAVVVPYYDEQAMKYSVSVVSGTVQAEGGIYARLDGGSASIADIRNEYHGNSKCAWVSEANVGNIPIRQTSGGARSPNYTLKLKSNTMPEDRCKDAFVGMNHRKTDASDPVVHALRGSFDGAFMNCANMYYSDFSECRTAGDNAFRRSFYGCERLAKDDFEKLEIAGDSCFSEAHVGTSVTNANFICLTSCGHKAFKDSYAGVTNVCDVRFPVLASCGSNAFDHAFAISATDRCSNISTIDFSNLETAGNGAFNKAFVGSTNLVYASFDSLKSGTVDLACGDSYAGISWPYESPLVLSCSNIAASAVVDISNRKNVKEICFDTVPDIVNYDSRWIPQNTDWKAYVPADLLLAWRASDGWMNYSTNIVLRSKAFTPWVATAIQSGPYPARQDVADAVNANPQFWEYLEEHDTWVWRGPDIIIQDERWFCGSFFFSEEGEGVDATKLKGGFFENRDTGDFAYMKVERSVLQ